MMIFLVHASEGWAPMPWMAMMLCTRWVRLCLRRMEGQDKKKGRMGRKGIDLLNQSFIPFIVFSIHENSKAGILSCDGSDLGTEGGESQSHSIQSSLT